MRFHLNLAIFAASVAAIGSQSMAQQIETLNASPVRSGELVRTETVLSSHANNLNQNQWIRLSDEGSIRGSVASLVGQRHEPQANVRVALVQEGRVVRQTVTDSEGDFMIEEAAAGTYSLVAQGENQLAVCGLTVLSKANGAHLPDRVQVRSISPATPRVAELVRGNTMPKWTIGTQPTKDPIAPIRKFASSCEIKLDDQGGISGTVARADASLDLSSTVLYLVRDGREIARTRAATNGAYRFDKVAPGNYGLVASGAEGIAAVGFCAVANNLAYAGQSAARLVSQDTKADALAAPVPPATEHLNVELAEPNCFVPAEVIPVEECIASDAAACSPTMGGCCNGGFTGGGGGGGGGFHHGGMGGWGTLAALGALGAVAIVQADKNNDAVIVSPIK